MQRTPHINRAVQPTFQYSSNRSISERIQRERPTQEGEGGGDSFLRVVVSRLTYLAGGALFVFVVFYLSILTAAPKIKVQAQTPIRDTQAYKQAANELAGSGLGNHSKLTINRQKIADELVKRFPELSSVQVQTPIFSQSAVIKAIATPPAVLLRVQGATYALNQQGVALFDVRDNPIDTKNLLEVNDGTGAPLRVGKPALTSAQIDFITELKHQSDAKQLQFDEITMVAGGGELDVRYAGLPYFVKFNLYEDARKSFGTFNAARQFSESNKTAPAEYMDVRLPERAYIK